MCVHLTLLVLCFQAYMSSMNLIGLFISACACVYICTCVYMCALECAYVCVRCVRVHFWGCVFIIQQPIINSCCGGDWDKDREQAGRRTKCVWRENLVWSYDIWQDHLKPNKSRECRKIKEKEEICSKKSSQQCQVVKLATLPFNSCQLGLAQAKRILSKGWGVIDNGWTVYGRNYLYNIPVCVSLDLCISASYCCVCVRGLINRQPHIVAFPWVPGPNSLLSSNNIHIHTHYEASSLCVLSHIHQIYMWQQTHTQGRLM